MHVMGKSHQLPYPKSTSVSTSPLDLVFHMYGALLLLPLDAIHIMLALSMIITILHGYIFCIKSEVFQCFRDFQQLAERQFNRKILAMQTDWGG
jgi:hypothetical protein